MKINGKPDGGGGGGVITELSVTSNGIYIAGAGVDGYSPIDVDVQPVLESLSVSANGTYTPGQGVDGYGQVEVSVPIPTPVTSVLSVSVNNTYYPGHGVTGFSQVIVDVPQSVTGFTEKDLTEQTFNITNLNNSASYVATNAFYNNNNIQTVNLPNCKVVQAHAFQGCQYLSEISLPVCETISSGAFNYTGLKTVYLPSCKSLGSDAFRYCLSLTEVNIPELVNVEQNIFQECSSLISVSFEKLSLVSYGMFSGCRSLKDVYMPNVRYVSAFGFNWCTSLESVDFLPECLFLNSYAFTYGSKISYVNLPYCTTIGSSAFIGCTSLTTVSLPMCDHIGPSAFNNVNITELDFPMCTKIWSYNFNMSIVTKVNLPILRYIYPQFWNTRPTSLLSELSIGNRIYYIPSYLSDFSALLSNGGSIYVDAAMWDKWLSASGWSSLSAAFVSFGDANEPMLSFSDGTVYGKTWGLWYGFIATSIINVQTSQVTALDLSQCRFVNGIEYSAITSINLPECKCLGDACNMLHLETVNLPKCEVIECRKLFSDCGSSASIYLGSGLSTVCKLNLIQGHSVGNVKFYVPASLVDAYKSAYGWSTISSKIFPIPE